MKSNKLDSVDHHELTKPKGFPDIIFKEMKQHFLTCLTSSMV